MPPYVPLLASECICMKDHKNSILHFSYADEPRTKVPTDNMLLESIIRDQIVPVEKPDSIYRVVVQRVDENEMGGYVITTVFWNGAGYCPRLSFTFPGFDRNASANCVPDIMVVIASLRFKIWGNPRVRRTAFATGNPRQSISFGFRMSISASVNCRQDQLRSLAGTR